MKTMLILDAEDILTHGFGLCLHVNVPNGPTIVLNEKAAAELAMDIEHWQNNRACDDELKAEAADQATPFPNIEYMGDAAIRGALRMKLQQAIAFLEQPDKCALATQVTADVLEKLKEPLRYKLKKT